MNYFSVADQFKLFGDAFPQTLLKPKYHDGSLQAAGGVINLNPHINFRTQRRFPSFSGILSGYLSECSCFWRRMLFENRSGGCMDGTSLPWRQQFCVAPNDIIQFCKTVRKWRPVIFIHLRPLSLQSENQSDNSVSLRAAVVNIFLRMCPLCFCLLEKLSPDAPVGLVSFTARLQRDFNEF